MFQWVLVVVTVTVTISTTRVTVRGETGGCPSDSPKGEGQLGATGLVSMTFDVDSARVEVTDILQQIGGPCVPTGVVVMRAAEWCSVYVVVSSCLLHTVGGPPAVRTDGEVLATSGNGACPCLPLLGGTYPVILVLVSANSKSLINAGLYIDMVGDAEVTPVVMIADPTEGLLHFE